MTTIDQELYEKKSTQAKKKFNEIFDYEQYFKFLENIYKNKPTYTFEQAKEKTLKYFDGSETETNVFLNKYALRNVEGEYLELDPSDMHFRLAYSISWVDGQYFKYDNPDATDEEYQNHIGEKFDEYYESFENFGKIIPQGSPMAGIGNPFQVMSLSNCFVVGNDADSYAGIMDIDQKLAQLMKRRAGVGTDISHLRPANSAVQNAARTSTGAASFMERFSNTTREVAQSGRRGALMLSIHIAHPDSVRIDPSQWDDPQEITIAGNPEQGQRDIETDSRYYNPDVLDFASSKLDRTKVTGANISLRINDEFMEAVKEENVFTKRFPIDSKNPLVVEEIDAKKAWDKIMHMAWQSAEPGVLFWDTIIKESLPDMYSSLGFESRSTNPCGELVLCFGDSCRLIVENLYSFVKNKFTKDAYFDFEEFKKYVKQAQRIIDNIVDLEVMHIQKIINKIKADPEDEKIKRDEIDLWNVVLEKALLGRRTGNGITAMGDMLASMNYRYGSEEANDFAEKVMKFKKHAEYEASMELAQDRGTFEIWDHELEKDNVFLNRIKEENEELYNNLKKYGRRNIAISTIAPTGSVSMMAQTSSGIENVYSIVYYRSVKINPDDQNTRTDFVDQNGDHWMEYPVFHHNFKDYLKAQGLSESKIKELSKEQIDTYIKMSPYFKATTQNVDWLSKVKMQGRVQKHIDHSISVTTNLPEEATQETISDIYLTAWESGCKGCTIYRDGSRTGVLNTSSKKDEVVDTKDPEKFGDLDAPKRPKKLECDVHHFQNRGEKWVSFVGKLNNRPYEIFTGLQEAFDIPASVDEGEIVKVKTDNETRYDFHYKYYNKPVIAEGLSNVFNKEYWNYAKLISSILRHQMPIQYVVKVLEGLKLENESISSWKRGVIRILKKYIQDGTKVETVSECNCDDGGNIIYQDGCMICTECAYSLCS